MRKMLWFGTAVAVMVAGLVMTMACYSDAHPHSLAGRAVAVAMELNPVVYLGQFIGQKSMKLIKEVQPSAPVASRSCCREVPKKPVATPSTPEIIDLSRLIDVSQVSEGEASEPPVPEETPAVNPVQVETVGPIGIEEEGQLGEQADEPEGIKGLIREISEVILDEEYKGAEVLPMPREEVVKEETLKEETTEEVLPQPREQGAEEQTESIHEGKAPTNQVDPHAVEECPSCPYMGGCPAKR